MNAPLYPYNLFSFNTSLVAAVIIGFFFGFILERAGLSNPRKLTALFFLDDFTVLKVILTAILTAGTGLWLLSRFGAIDMSQVYIVHTYLWPQFLGGFVLGVGFVIGGYCPGTSVVGFASGKIDALIFFIGLMLGILLFSEIYPYISNFYLSGKMGPMTLQKWFGASQRNTILIIALFALITFLIAEKLENR